MNRKLNCFYKRMFFALVLGVLLVGCGEVQVDENSILPGGGESVDNLPSTLEEITVPAPTGTVREITETPFLLPTGTRPELNPTNTAVPSDTLLPSASPAVPGSSNQEGILSAVKDHLARKLKVSLAEITVIMVEEEIWSDASLGCPEPGMMYAQVLTPGYQIILEAGGERYDYRMDQSGNIKLCQ